jgi:hypothetical protein
MNDIQTRVDALLPGGDVARKRNRLMKLRKIANEDRVTAIQRELDDAVARYAAGEDIDVMTIARRWQDATTEHLAARQMWVVVDSYDAQIRTEAEAIQVAATAPALRLLRSELASLVERVKDLDLILDDVHDASTAIRRGVAEQWRELEEAADEYSHLRAAQLSVYERIAGVDPVNAKTFMLHMGLHADALVTSEDHRVARLQSAQMSPASYPEEKSWVGWLRSGPAPVVAKRAEGTWLAPDRYRYVRQVCTLAVPWIPDWTTLEAASHAAGLASAATDGSGDTRRLVAARNQYEQITGTTITTATPAAV